MESKFEVYDRHGRWQGRMTYKEYLQSPAWKDRASYFKSLDGNRCRACGGTKRLTTHHKHYNSLGSEVYFDCETLCWGCHQKEHKKKKRGIPLFKF